MTAKISHTTLVMEDLLKRTLKLVQQAPKRDNVELLTEIQEEVNELHDDVEYAEQKLQELIEELDQLFDNYETWSDEENDRDSRMDARDEIEAASSNIEALVEELEQVLDD